MADIGQSPLLLLLLVFPACDGIRTGSKLPSWTAYFPELAYGILGKGVLFVEPPLEDTGLTGSSTQAKADCRFIGSSVNDCQVLSWPVFKNEEPIEIPVTV